MTDFGFQTSQASGTSGISGSGTTNYVSKFTSASAIGDSQLFDNGSNVGINNSSPSAKLDILGIDALSTTYSLKINDSIPNNLLSVRNDGFVFVGSSAKDSYLWLQSAGGTLGLTNENGFASILANATKLFISNGGSGSNVFAQINTSNGNWLLGNPSTNVNTANLTNTKLYLQGVDATSSNYGLRVENSASGNLLLVRNDGYIQTAGLLKVLSSALYPSLTFENSVGHIAKIEMYSNELYFITGTQQTVLNATGLSLGTNAGAGARLQVRGVDATSSNFALKIENSTPTNLFSIRNDGVIDVYGTITPRLQTIVSSANVTPTNLNDEVVITAQAVGLTLVNPTGTAVQGQSMIIRIKDNGTARTIAYDTQYRAIGVTLPTTTVISKTLYLGLIYNSTDTKWDVIGVSQEA